MPTVVSERVSIQKLIGRLLLGLGLVGIMWSFVAPKTGVIHHHISQIIDLGLVSAVAGLVVLFGRMGRGAALGALGVVAAIAVLLLVGSF